MHDLLENFICLDCKKVLAKLEKIRGGGRERVYLACDFDRTITPFFNQKGEEISTWGLLSAKLPAAIRAEEIRLYEKYRPLEIAGKMTVAQAVEWWSKNLDLYEKSKLNWSDLELEVKEAIPARPGAKELFDLCEERKIPIVIVSAGIKDVIELWCEKFEVNPYKILSTKLFFDAKGYVCGWDKNSLVHALNKNEVGRELFAELGKTQPFSILIGDSLDDAAIIDGSDNVLRLFVDDAANKNDGFNKKIFEKFDLILKTDSLMPVVKMIASI